MGRSGSGRCLNNTVLRQVGEPCFRMLEPHLEPVELVAKDVLHVSGRMPEHLYFPEGGVLSFAFDLPGGRTVNFGLVGRESVSSFSVMRPGRRSLVRSVVLVGGAKAHRVAREPLQRAFHDREDLRAALYECLYALMGQLAYTAMSNGAHSLKERLARWLLLCDDRLEGEPIVATHGFFAQALTAQRTTITTLLHVLEGEGAIQNTRGVVRIRDRGLLVRIAGEAYVDAVDDGPISAVG